MFAIGIDLRLEKQKSKKDNEPFIIFKDMVNEYLEHYRSYRNEKYWQGVEAYLGGMFYQLLAIYLLRDHCKIVSSNYGNIKYHKSKKFLWA